MVLIIEKLSDSSEMEGTSSSPSSGGCGDNIDPTELLADLVYQHPHRKTLNLSDNSKGQMEDFKCIRGVAVFALSVLPFIPISICC